jgi:hypothetical protein
MYKSATPAAMLKPIHNGQKVITIFGAEASIGLPVTWSFSAAPFKTASMARMLAKGKIVKQRMPATAAIIANTRLSFISV